jgi:RRXRR protein/HNH endonuclease
MNQTINVKHEPFASSLSAAFHSLRKHGFRVVQDPGADKLPHADQARHACEAACLLPGVPASTDNLTTEPVHVVARALLENGKFNMDCVGGSGQRAGNNLAMSVLVIDLQGKHLEPCSAERAESLLQRQRAVLVSQEPFAIQLTRVTGNGVASTPAGMLIDGRTSNARKQRRKKDKRVEQLKRRDGDDCFYCGLPLLDDVTCEHLLSQADGGTGKLANLVLTHRKCNEEAADLPIVEKVKLRDRLRSRPTYAQN